MFFFPNSREGNVHLALILAWAFYSEGQPCSHSADLLLLFLRLKTMWLCSSQTRVLAHHGTTLHLKNCNLAIKEKTVMASGWKKGILRQLKLLKCIKRCSFFKHGEEVKVGQLIHVKYFCRYTIRQSLKSWLLVYQVQVTQQSVQWNICLGAIANTCCFFIQHETLNKVRFARCQNSC